MLGATLLMVGWVAASLTLLTLDGLPVRTLVAQPLTPLELGRLPIRQLATQLLTPLL